MLSKNRQDFQQFLAQTSPEPVGLEIASAKGSYLYDTSGKPYLDLISGISVSSLGHGNQKITAAIEQQLHRFSHVMVYGELVLAPQTELAAKLAQLLPESLSNAYFVNSGSEATEATIKLVRRYTGRRKILAQKKAYHGSTTGALSLMSEAYYSGAYRPLLPGIDFLEQNEEIPSDFMDAEIAAVFIEPVMGEKGAVACDLNYLRSVADFCRRNGSLLVFDEIQTGMGRTGSFFAFQKYGIVPDVLMVGKAFGGGLPLGAVISSKEIMSAFQENPVLGHITTFGGHPLSCAASLAACEEIESIIVSEEVVKKEALFREQLVHPEILKLDGMGLLLAAELKSESICKALIYKCMDKGVFADWFLYAPHKLRIAPPLNISEADVLFACEVIQSSLDDLAVS